MRNQNETKMVKIGEDKDRLRTKNVRCAICDICKKELQVFSEILMNSC